MAATTYRLAAHVWPGHRIEWLNNGQKAVDGWEQKTDDDGAVYTRWKTLSILV